MDHQELLRFTLSAVEAVYSRYRPWSPKVAQRESDWTPTYIPLDNESDFSHQLFHEMGNRGKELLVKKNHTCCLHTETALGWLSGFKKAVRNGRYRGIQSKRLAEDEIGCDAD